MFAPLFLQIIFLALSQAITWDNSTSFARSLTTKFISFNPIGEDISISFDVDAPFLSIAAKKQPFDPNQALINLNTPALITSALVIGVSFFMGLVFKAKSHIQKDADRQSRFVIDDFLYNFNLSVQSPNGKSVDTNCLQLWSILEDRINQPYSNFNDCISKVKCFIQHNLQKFPFVEKILNSNRFIKESLNLKSFMNRSVLTGNVDVQNSDQYCQMKYADCDIIHF